MRRWLGFSCLLFILGTLSYAQTPMDKENPTNKFKGPFGKGNFKGFFKKDQKSDNSPPKAEPKATAEGIAFFEKQIRPVLVGQCLECHSSENNKLKGGLALDTREAIRKGGDSGPAVVPGDPRKSLLLKALSHTDANLKMPPKKKLEAEVIAQFEKWIAMGAPDPRDGAKVVAKTIDIEKGREFWAFQPPKISEPPKVNNASWPKNEVDRFVLSLLEAKGLQPVTDAEKTVLIRRLTYDLIGLPPTTEEIHNYLNDKSPNATEKVVDRLLASEAFGEHWGRHWLDVARYAESSGKTANIIYPHAWRYRDYVIDSYRADKPFNQFIKEQIAGDLLPAKDDQHKAELLVATGFLAIGPKSHNERNPLQFQMDLIDEQIDTTTQAFLGLTVACARCHDHKFDPIPQKDYYALVGIFKSTQTCYGTIRNIQSNHPAPLLNLPEGAKVTLMDPIPQSRIESMQKQLDDLRKEKIDFKEINAFVRNRIQIGNLEAVLRMYNKDGTPKAMAMGVREKDRPQEAQVYTRGEIDKPGEQVKRGVPQVLTKKPLSISSGSGRKELAEWMASADNPLTARVYVNRVWSHLFGQGIVPTVDNFGASGQLPTNEPLLDHLANWFTQNDWSTKKLIKYLVMSRTYQLSSATTPENLEKDPENVYNWRHSPRRLTAEEIHDSLLVYAGLLDTSRSKASPISSAGETGTQGLLFRLGGTSNESRYRSVYTPIVREQLPEWLTLFDFPDPNVPNGERATTTVPAQALYLMNNPTVLKYAENAAEKIRSSGETEEGKIAKAYEMAFGRKPSETETKKAKEFLAKYSKQFGRVGGEKAAWAAFTQALVAASEFTTVK